VRIESDKPLPTRLTLSEITPTFTPVPSTPKFVRAVAALMAVSAWLAAIPLLRTYGRRMGAICATSWRAATSRSALIGR